MKKKEENQSVVFAITILFKTFTPLFPHIPLYFYTQSIKVGAKKTERNVLVEVEEKVIENNKYDDENKRTRRKMRTNKMKRI
jgi:glycine betaine/choline ABC-type transport system substrate-binding protein